MMAGAGGTAYGMVRAFASGKLGRFTISDVLGHCPGIGRSSAAAALRKLAEEGAVSRYGAARGTYYASNPDGMSSLD